MHQNTPYLDFVCKSHKGSKFVLVDDPKPTLDPDIKVVDILKIKLYLLCKNFARWFWAGMSISTPCTIVAIWQELGFNIIFISWQDLVT